MRCGVIHLKMGGDLHRLIQDKRFPFNLLFWVRFMVKSFQQSLVALAFLLAFVSPLAGQDPTGVLEGQITDPSGALIPKASVTVKNSATGFEATQESSPTGGYRFSYLPVGSYNLRISAKGFAAFEARSIRIDVNRVVNLPATLRLPRGGATVDIRATEASVDVS